MLHGGTSRGDRPLAGGVGRPQPTAHRVPGDRGLPLERALAAVAHLASFGFSPSWLSAAMKASCGISTVPTIFMRFLPSFCFSSSLRLRLMSPP